jgi:hypothetical protein
MFAMFLFEKVENHSFVISEKLKNQNAENVLFMI